MLCSHKRRCDKPCLVIGREWDEMKWLLSSQCRFVLVYFNFQVNQRTSVGISLKKSFNLYKYFVFVYSVWRILEWRKKKISCVAARESKEQEEDSSRDQELNLITFFSFNLKKKLITWLQRRKMWGGKKNACNLLNKFKINKLHKWPLSWRCDI